MPSKKYNKNSDSKNLLWAIIAFFIIIIILAAYFSQRAVEKSGEIINHAQKRQEEIEHQIRVLHKQRDSIQQQRLSAKVDILYYNTLRVWAEQYINRVFARFRWLLFIAVTFFFVVAAFKDNFLGLTIDQLLKYISVTVILLALFFFANSEENESLATSYKRTKVKAIDKSIQFIKWYYRTVKGVKIEKEAYTVKEYDLYVQLVPIMNELRILKRQL